VSQRMVSNRARPCRTVTMQMAMESRRRDDEGLFFWWEKHLALGESGQPAYLSL
jgi:hypothetical protein